MFRMALTSGSVATVLLHLRRGADPDARDAVGWTPLMLAASRGRVDTCHLLFEEGADPELRDASGRTALSIASAAGHVAIVRLLHRDGSLDRSPQPTSTLPVAAPVHPAADGQSSISEGAGNGAAALAEGDEWEVEQESISPGQAEEVVRAVAAAQADVSEHRSLDRDEDWSDVVVALPVPPRSITREPELARQIARLRQLFAISLAAGEVRADDVRGIFESPLGGHDAALRELRLAASVVTLRELGSISDDPEEWFTSESLPLQATGQSTLLDQAEQFFEDLCTAPDSLESYLQDISRHPTLRPEEERRLWLLKQEGLRKLCEIILEHPSAHAGLASIISQHAVSHSSNSDEVENEDAEVAEDPGVRVRPSIAFPPPGEPVLPIPVERALACLEESARGTTPLTGSNRRLIAELVLGLAVPSDRVERLATSLAFDPEAGADPSVIGVILAKLRNVKIRLFTGYLRLVVYVARKNQWRGLQLVDLIQDGNIGLLKAVDRYDVSRGHKFTTYAIWWLRQSMSRAAQDGAAIVRIPVHLQERLARFYKSVAALETRHGRLLGLDELATALELPVDRVRTYLSVPREMIGIDGLSFSATEDECIDFLDETPSPFDQAVANDLRETIGRVLVTLSAREERVLRLRFGLGSGEEMTLEEVGEQFGVTRERIRQIEAKAMLRLQRPSRSRQLRSFSGELN